MGVLIIGVTFEKGFKSFLRQALFFQVHKALGRQ